MTDPARLLRRTATEDERDARLDALVTALAEAEGEPLTRTAAQRRIEAGDVTVNGAPRPKNYRVRAGDEIELTLLAPVALDVRPQEIPLDIVYEDGDLLVVNKPKGMVVHPAAGNPDGTLVNALLWHCAGGLSGINGVLRPGIVHRIDKDTSGLLLVAKNDAAHLSLSEQIAAHTVDRVYQAVVHGVFRDEAGTVDAPIGRSDRDRKKFCVTDRNAKRAVTHFTVVRRFSAYTQLELRLETGRTHQIRVHMAYLGHPVAGDAVYGPRGTPRKLCGQCLHAGHIAFTHPKTGERMDFTAPLPDYFTAFVRGLT